MKIPDPTGLWVDENLRSLKRKRLTFREIYEAIQWSEEFNEPQLYYLSRLVQRKIAETHSGSMAPKPSRAATTSRSLN